MQIYVLPVSCLNWPKKVTVLVKLRRKSLQLKATCAKNYGARESWLMASEKSTEGLSYRPSTPDEFIDYSIRTMSTWYVPGMYLYYIYIYFEVQLTELHADLFSRHASPLDVCVFVAVDDRER